MRRPLPPMLPLARTMMLTLVLPLVLTPMLTPTLTSTPDPVLCGQRACGNTWRTSRPCPSSEPTDPAQEVPMLAVTAVEVPVLAVAAAMTAAVLAMTVAMTAGVPVLAVPLCSPSSNGSTQRLRSNSTRRGTYGTMRGS